MPSLSPHPGAGKLVRDRIPDLIAKNGGQASTRVLTQEEYVQALLLKSVEEAQELSKAEPQDRLDEVADVLEVLKALVRTLGLEWEEIEVRRKQKREQRGGFDRRIWLAASKQ